MEDRNLVPIVKKSPPLDFTKPCDPSGVAGKTILVTGGASGFGAGFARHWAAHGANIIVGDINDAAGEALVASLRQGGDNPDTSSASSSASPSVHKHHYIHVDVTDWASQVTFFRTAARLSPTGAIDGVVANAGKLDTNFQTLNPATDSNLDGADGGAIPEAPDMRCFDVNVTGVFYTTHLAMYWLPRNGSGAGRDRHLLLIGSVAPLMPFPPAPQYATSKHAVLGLWRALRGHAWRSAVRVNLLCPYFADTPLATPPHRLLMAGTVLARVDQVVEAATRLMADGAVNGRAVMVGPRLRFREGAERLERDGDEFEILGVDESEAQLDGKEGAVVSAWEVYAQDYENVDIFTYRFATALHYMENMRGWTGWVADIFRAVKLMYTTKPPVEGSRGAGKQP